ncbi:hypothetical protein MYP_3632 [Sporocytophaga myxococcoides]|uniref:Uncharacterized protein n=1 Tax=Sporocytophaga myxococcoides TaxID=153721 RepID=A0A098LJU5_9BACT|nr:hypothetical protein [Sporocytophaga myxococcoides]GAL86403.1 hypothetical protein MYP_3632 [Sporocytophaga myxococcoides]
MNLGIVLFISSFFFTNSDSLYLDGFNVKNRRIEINFFNEKIHDPYSQVYLISRNDIGEFFIFNDKKYYINTINDLDSTTQKEIIDYFNEKITLNCYTPIVPKVILSLLLDENGKVVLGGGYINYGCERNFLEVHNFIDLHKVKFSPSRIKFKNVPSILNIVLPLNEAKSASE